MRSGDNENRNDPDNEGMVKAALILLSAPAIAALVIIGLLLTWSA